MKNKRVVLANRPKGDPQESDFRIEETEPPEPKDGEVLLRTIYLSLDPYMRGRMSAGKSYAAPIEIGDVMQGETVCEVIKTKSEKYRVGDIVTAYIGWQEYGIAPDGVRKLDPSAAPISTALGVLGMPGLTAYTGLLLIGQPKSGETVCVAAATGPVGSAVGQIAKIKGCRTIGIAGGADKCKALTELFGFDVAVDHRSPTFADDLALASPAGIDVYFENVGGEVWGAVRKLLNDFARIPVCGQIAHYSATELPPGPDHLPELMVQILRQRLTLRGFIVSDFVEQAPAFYEDMTDWIKSGQIKYKEDIVEGIKAAPKAFIGLFKGKNFGKLLVRVGNIAGSGI